MLVCVRKDITDVYEMLVKRFKAKFVYYYDIRNELRSISDLKEVINESKADTLLIFANFEYALDLLSEKQIKTAIVVLNAKNVLLHEHRFVVYIIDANANIEKIYV